MNVYIQVTIGRNVENKPMSVQDWSDYKLFINGALGSAVSSPINTLDGQGRWTDEDTGETITEDCYAITAIITGHHVNKIPQIKESIAHCANLFGQDAVAVVIVPLIDGDETLIYASE